MVRLISSYTDLSSVYFYDEMRAIGEKRRFSHTITGDVEQFEKEGEFSWMEQRLP